MRDALEDRLATRLGTLGETVDDELPLPVDLELQVRHRRQRARATRRWASVGIAAAIVVAGTTVAVVHGTTGGSPIRIATSPTTAVPVHDSLQAGTVMLAARGRFVISLDAQGHTNATMVATLHGDIRYARATEDHRALWYLSLKKGPNACGDVVRADIDGRTSTIVTHAVAFDVSPDGSRLALYGAGDLARDRCSPVRNGSDGRVVVLDLTSSASSALTVRNVTSLRWSADGSYLVAVSCPAVGCEGFRILDVPRVLGGPLTFVPGAWNAYPALHSATVAVGPDGLYILESIVPITSRPTVTPTATSQIDRVDPRSARPPLTILSTDDWVVSQVVPTSAGTYVVAARRQPSNAKTRDAGQQGLYRLVAGRLVAVRNLAEPGTLVPVTPLVAAG